ncbi:hypothetical protein BHM03_00003693 [Ensete ventricosum]|nr:hypothetical protein BHM03_00003693 [Ensete ventricosum]
MIKKKLLQWLSVIYFRHRFELCLQVQMFGTYSYKTSDLFNHPQRRRSWRFSHCFTCSNVITFTNDGQEKKKKKMDHIEYCDGFSVFKPYKCFI